MQALTKGDAVRLHLDAEHVHLFDEDGQALPASA
jgi:hypothetical protein